jgi:hypothetical protein
MEMQRMKPNAAGQLGWPPPFFACCWCGSVTLDPPPIDIGKATGDGGKFCVCTTCVMTAGHVAGMLAAPDAAALNARVDALTTEVAELEQALAQAGTDARSVELAKRLLAADAEYAAVSEELTENPQLAEPKAARGVKARS